MSRKITLCLHALYLMYPLTSYGSVTLYGSETPYSADLMDKSSVESESVDTVPNRRCDEASAIRSHIQSDCQPQHKNAISSPEGDKVSRPGKVMRPSIPFFVRHQNSVINSIMTPKTIALQNSPKPILRPLSQNSFKLIRDKKSLNQEESALIKKSPARNLSNSSHSDHNEGHLKKLKIKDSQSNIFNDKNKPPQRASQSKVLQAINANLYHPIQDFMLKTIASYNEHILGNDVHVQNMKKPYSNLIENGWALLKENAQYIGERVPEYVEQGTEYLDRYNRNGIRGESRFQDMVNILIWLNDKLDPEPKPKGVVAAINDAPNQPHPEMTKRINYWVTEATNNIIEFGQQNLRTYHALKELYHNSVNSLSELKQQSTKMNYDAPEFVDLKTNTNYIFNQLQIKAQELGIDNAYLAKARQKIKNIGGDQKDQDCGVYNEIARSAPHDVNVLPPSKTYHRKDLQDDEKEITIKVPPTRIVEIR